MASRTSRNEAVSQVVADWLAANPISGSTLVLDDGIGRIASELADLGVEATTWQRMSAMGPTWLPEGSWDNVILRLPKGKEALELYVHAVASRLNKGGRLFVCGANDEGVKSSSKRIEGVFSDVSTVETRRRCRIFRATNPQSDVRSDLAEWGVSCADGELSWTSFPGVFAHGRLDAGTRDLLTRVEDPDPKSRVLDFGCGAGVVGLEMQRRVPGLTVDLLDIDGLAIEAARRNLPGCRVIQSDGWEQVRGERWDVILSNPPFHDGVARNHEVLDRLVREAPDHLTRGGVLYVVCQRNVPVMDRLVEVFGDRRSERLHMGRYQVWKAIRSRRL